MYAVSARNVERSIKVDLSATEKWDRVTNPVTRHEDARREMERHGTALFKGRGMPPWALDIVRTCANRRNVALPTIAGDHRFRDAVKARNEAMYLIYLQKAHSPSLSCPKIGKWFDRDHTSVLHGIASHQEANGLARIVGYDIVSARIRSAACMSTKRRAKCL